ncbi:hypothetical protein PAXRUDRAFT_36458 [Paxillus rubicundulus Ve08.2h10]|uniref:DUF6532 domain-containing protein n=1 Tax=Paxillus rubicundulus Ve08.2h10 TaxID=930991 RepID=A0A0D0DEN5_9AGAM|nr:hypothetical protein PAXRUDRAFT_36458 [Paxillus rubicundulus Ve08.2h10]
MSSRAPSRSALDRAINGPSSADAGTQMRAPDERRDRELQWHKPKAKASRQNQENRGQRFFASRDIDLRTPQTMPAVNLIPQSGRVPPLSVPPKTDEPLYQHQVNSNCLNDVDANPFRDSEPDLGGESGNEDNVTASGKCHRQTKGDVLDDGHSDDNEQDGKWMRISADNDNQGWHNPKKIQTSKGRVAAKDYEVAVQEILKIAIGLFRSCLTVENAYPDRISQVSWAKEAWVEACKECEAQINYNNEVIQLITNRTWHLTMMYGFESSAKSVIKARNRKLVEDLTEDFGFCYKSLGDSADDVGRKGLYEHKIIRKAVNISFYKDKRDEGVRYPQYFQPFPVAGKALILTVIEACIDEWSSGERCDIQFNEPIYKPVYHIHLSQLQKFAEYTKTHEILPKMLKRLDDSGRQHAKVETPLDTIQKRALREDAIAAAIHEYEMHNGQLSDEDDLDE